MIDKNSITAYNFIASIFKWDKINSLDDISIKSRFPKKVVEMYSVEDHRLLGELYIFIGDAYWVKVNDKGEASELYFKNHPKYPDCWGVSINPETLKPIEYYKETLKTIKKYDFKTNVLLQTNYFVSGFDDLPKTYQEKLKNFDHKDKIFYYANKPYGKIVEISV